MHSLTTHRAIVLGVKKYTDKHSIAHVYSDQRGRLSLLVPQGNTRGARMRNALLMPLSVVEVVARQASATTPAVGQHVRRLQAVDNIYCDPIKSAIALYMSELLTRTVQEQERNELLFEYVKASALLLNDISHGVANFHVCFTWHLAPLLGIQPDMDTYHDAARAGGGKCWFDMQGGVFTPVATLASQCLPPDKALAMWQLSRMTFANMHLFRYSRAQRRELLELMLAYLKLHHLAVGTMHSPEILKEVFD